ncbi:FAD-dependent oxidoreductase [Leucobacter sp. GX24907]
MRVIVVGGGVVGITTAWTLSQRGHDVALFERAEEVATEATASNAGMLVPGDSVVWASPAAVGLLARALIPSKAGFIKVRPGAGLGLIPWGLRFLRECFPSRVARNIRHAHALSAYSLLELERIIADLGQDVAFEHTGMAFIGSDSAHLERLAHDRAGLAELGEHYEAVPGTEFARRDPAYGSLVTEQGESVGVLYTPGAAHGDSEAFSRALLTEAVARYSVDVRLSTPVLGIIRRAGRVTGVRTGSGDVSADAVVLAAGARTRELAREVGIRLPILPAKGYAITVPAVEGAQLPRIGGVDERAHVAFSRVVNGMRFSSTAEFAGYDTSQSAENYTSIRDVAAKLLPGALDWDRAVHHSGWRPSTPHSNPYIGATKVPGLLINSGHSHLGWTQAAGSAELLADLLDGATPEIDPTPYAVP